MWSSRFLCCLLTAGQLYLLNLVHILEAGTPDTPQNLTCITHNLNDVVCTWTTVSTVVGLSYKFCVTNSTSSTCVETKEKKAYTSLIAFGSVSIKILTVNADGTSSAENTFELNERNIFFVPPTPHNVQLTADFPTGTLNLEWDDGGSTFPFQLDATWEIQILRNDPMVTAALETYDSKLAGSDTSLLWKWMSDIPLECTPHYVRIRCFLHEDEFLGSKTWSEWSQLVSVPGYRDLGSEPAKMFPQDKVVPVGTNVTFCCVHKEGERVTSLDYGECSNTFGLQDSLGSKSPPSNECPLHQCQFSRLTNWSLSIYVPNASCVRAGGINAWCISETPPVKGTVLFIGYPPDVPQNLSCETGDFENITCKWKPGRNTVLFGPRRTYYTLFERISGKHVSYQGNPYPDVYHCNFTANYSQKIYNFTVHASNHLGQSESSLVININNRVHPQTPAQLHVIDNSPSNISLSWNLPGNFVDFTLRCQVQINSTSFRKKQLVLLNGAKNSLYRAAVGSLHPCTTYNFQVRCSAVEPFYWKWSGWSKTYRHTTMQDRPTRGPDVWRERSPDGENVTICWKPLPLSETNGIVEAYEVFWSHAEMPTHSKQVLAPIDNVVIPLKKNDYIFSVVAKNKAGSSPPSEINSAEIPTDNAPTKKGDAKGDGIYIGWHPDPSVTCGYTVRWFNATGLQTCGVEWQTFPSSTTGALIKSALFQPGVQYTFSVYGCKAKGYQLLNYINGYTQELRPKVAPNFTVVQPTSDSIVVSWEDIPIKDHQGFLKGYLLEFAKGEEGTVKPKDFESGHSDTRINITDLKQKSLKLSNLQGKTSYRLELSAYTAAGYGPSNKVYVVTKENSVGLIIAIIIPVAIVILLGVVTSIFCYRKREWIKETFYPDIPNPENCKALEFQKGLCEENPNPKTLEMNPCTPNNIEVVETQSPCLKVEETAVTSPVEDELPEDDFGSGSHVVVSYCPPIIEEEISNLPVDESAGSSQVVYIDIQSMYPSQVKLKEDPEVDCVTAAGYKPQMQLPVTQVVNESLGEEDLDEGAGYRPQVNASAWNMEPGSCPDSPGSTESNNENASFGSPCSINSRQFLIPPKEDEDSPKAIASGWSFANFFHNKPND